MSFATHTPRLRCDVCLMHEQICMCDVFEPMELVRSRVVMIIHGRDARKPSNTGRLVGKCLHPVETQIRGLPGSRVDQSCIHADDSFESLVLFPSDSAEVLTEELVVGTGKRINLIVPDGNWKQASRIPKREPALIGVRNVILPPGPPSRYRLRHEPRKPYGLATIEATARALAIIEGPEAEEQLMRVFDIMVERTLWTKGVLERDRVRGGIPAEAITP